MSRARRLAAALAVAALMSGGLAAGSVALSAQPAQAAVDATLDEALGTGFDEPVRAVLPMPDGGMIIGGSIRGGLVRLRADGTRDSSWNREAQAALGLGPWVRTLALQAVGSSTRLLVGGVFVPPVPTGSTPAFAYLIRLNPDGTRDRSFSPVFNRPVNALAVVRVLGTDRVLVGGEFTSLNGAGSAPDGLLRLLVDGAADSAFNLGLGTGLDGPVNAIAVHGSVSQHRIVVGGNFSKLDGAASAPDNVLGLLASGIPDSLFNEQLRAGLNGTVEALAVRAGDINSPIAVGGSFTGTSSDDGPARLAFLLGNGGPAANLNDELGRGLDSTVAALAYAADGSLVVGGYFSALDGRAAAPDRLLRLRSDGTEATGFSDSLGSGFDEAILAVAISPSGDVLAGGRFHSLNRNADIADGLVRLSGQGAPPRAQGGVDPPDGLDGLVETILSLPDGSVLVGGSFTTFAGRDIPDALVKLAPDGSIDEDFNRRLGRGLSLPETCTGMCDHDRLASVHSIVSRGSSQLLVGGRFAVVGGRAAPRNFVQLPASGGFEGASGVNALLGSGFGMCSTTPCNLFLEQAAIVHAIAIQRVSGTDRILVGGFFRSFKGATAPIGLLRLDAVGRRDSAFAAALGTGFSSSVNALLVQPGTSRIVVGGNFAKLNNEEVPNALMRLLPDGQIDTGFAALQGSGLGQSVVGPFGSAPTIVNSLTLDTGSTFIAGGSFDVRNRVAVSANILRFDAAGTIDRGFTRTLRGGVDGEVHDVRRLADGRIAVVGDFTNTVQPTDVPPGVAVLGVDGRPSAAFEASYRQGLAGRLASGRAIAETSRGLLVGGSFTRIDGRDAPDGLSLLPARTEPGAPRNVVGTPGNGRATFRWQPPADDGGTDVVDYIVSIDRASGRCTVDDLTAVCTGLPNGRAARLTVHAVTRMGEGPTATSDPVTPRAG